MIEKNLILISYLESLNLGYKLKAEFSTNDDDVKVILVQIAPGTKQVLYDGEKLYDYFNIQIFGESIQEQKNTAVLIGDLIGENIIHEYNNKKYQLLFKQISNPQNIMYQDIRRVGYTMTLRVIIREIK